MNKKLIFFVIIITVLIIVSVIFIMNENEKRKNVSIQIRELAEICYKASLNKDFETYLQFRDLKLESGRIILANCNVGGVESSFSQGIDKYIESKLGKVRWRAAENVNEEGSDIKECNRLIDKFTTNGKTECSKILRVNGLLCTKEIWEYNKLNDDNLFSKDSQFNIGYLKNSKKVNCI